MKGRFYHSALATTRAPQRVRISAHDCTPDLMVGRGVPKAGSGRQATAKLPRAPVRLTHREDVNIWYLSCIDSSSEGYRYECRTISEGDFGSDGADGGGAGSRP